MGPYSKFSDAELTERLKSGDHAAFTEIYNRYMGILYIYAVKICKDPDEAEDLLHELFTTLWIKAPQLKLNNTLSAYLYRAVKNRAFDILSHRKIKQSYMESLADFLNQGQWETEETIREQELARLIESETAKLPPKMREVFEMSRVSNKTYKEIAQTLGISDRTVKKQISNALKHLKTKINLLIFSILI